MQALLVIDMQHGMRLGETTPRDLDGVIERINTAARLLRNAGAAIVFIQHHGERGDGFAPGEPGWPLLPELDRRDEDRVVAKTICDSFYKTELHSLLQDLGVRELVVAGWATDYCVDTTIRAAISHDYEVTVLADAHTAADREHLDAAAIVAHHNFTWSNLMCSGRTVRVVSTAEFARQFQHQDSSS